jgi:hypothetical protein
MNKELTIGKKLAIGLALLTACVGILSIVSLRAILTLGDSLDTAVNKVGKSIELVGGARDAFQNLKSDSLRAQVAFGIGELERRGGEKAQGNVPRSTRNRRDPRSNTGQRKGGAR